MKYFVCVVLSVGVLATPALSSMDLPSAFKVCRLSTPNYQECMKEAIRDAIIELGPGLRSFQILPMEPLSIDSITIGGNGGAVSLKQSYRNVKIHGLTRGLRLIDFDIDFNRGLIKYSTFHDQVDMVADYTVDGKILVLPVTGSGPSNITLLGLTAMARIDFETEQRDGETYLKVKHYETKFDPTKVFLKFENLFNGDKMLGDQMNIFINENSDLLFRELQGPFEETFALVFSNLANNIFSRVPISKIFLQ